MNRYGFLAALHRRLAPRSYLEIGVNDGRSLALSRSRTIGVDPNFKVVVDLACDLQLVKATSDEFFARPDALRWLPNHRADLTFIDGMHLFEFALRDFINAERHGEVTSVIVLDDVLPRAVEQAARVRVTRGWTGDVYKVALVLEKYRPDLTVLAINTQPTGVLVVLGLDPRNTVLADNYDQIIAEQTHSDPQDVPADVIHRRHAADPDAALAASIWDALQTARTEDRAPDPAHLRAVADLNGTAEFVVRPRTFQPWPPDRNDPFAKQLAKRFVDRIARQLR